MESGKLRYYALGAYTGLLALFVALDKIPMNENTAIALLGPIAVVLGADMIKHRSNTA